MIEVRGLTKKYASGTAVSGLDFTIEDGKIYGFLGPNGAGKSTTMNIITGCLAATDGEVTVNGFNVFREPLKAKKCIGYLPEIPPLYPDMTPAEYLTFVARAKGLKKSEAKAQIEDVMEKTGISGVKDKLIKHLSKGFKQRVGIAQAILGNPDIIILDEPTVGLDPIQIVEIRSLIRSLGEKHTVILSSHILPEVHEVCDEILIISGGRIVASDSAENLSRRFNPSTVIDITFMGDSETAGNAIRSVEGVTDAELVEGGGDEASVYKVHCGQNNDLREQLSLALMRSSIPVLSINIEKATLEDIFLEVTSENVSLLTGEGTSVSGDTAADSEEESSSDDNSGKEEPEETAEKESGLPEKEDECE